MRRDELLRENYEDALFYLLMNKIAEEEGKILLAENERLNRDPNAGLSEELDRRCKSTIKRTFAKQSRRDFTKISVKLISRIAIAASVAVLLFSTAYAVFPEVRVGMLNMLIKVSSVSSTLVFEESPEENSSDNHVQQTGYTLLGYQLPTLSQEFKLTDQGGDRKSSWIAFSNDSGASIVFKIHADLNTVYDIDTEAADSVEQILVNGYRGLLIIKEESIRITWGDIDNNYFIDIVYVGIDKDFAIELANKTVFEE